MWVGKTWREMTTSLLSAWFLVPTLDGHIVRALIISRLIYIRDDNQLSPISLSQGPTLGHYLSRLDLGGEKTRLLDRSPSLISSQPGPCICWPQLAVGMTERAGGRDGDGAGVRKWLI